MTLTWHITGSRSAGDETKAASQPASQPASSSGSCYLPTNGDDMPRGAASLILWHVNPLPCNFGFRFRFG